MQKSQEFSSSLCLRETPTLLCFLAGNHFLKNSPLPFLHLSPACVTFYFFELPSCQHFFWGGGVGGGTVVMHCILNLLTFLWNKSPDAC